MAIESERLLAVFEAKFSSLEKALSKARRDANKSFGDISAAGTRAENVLAKVGSRGMPGLTKATSQMNALQGQTGNLAAQFNDIGVQLASGQSPFLIAIQQGSQLNQVLGPAGARGAARALGGAFASMLNPVSLATFAIIGLGGAAVQYFASMLSDGDAANASLKEQASAIKQVADKWGDALPAVKAYSDELERQKEAAERLAATQLTISHLFEETAAAVSDVYTKMATLTGSASDLSAFQEGFTAAQISMRQFEDALKDGKATTEQYEGVNNELTKMLGIDAVEANTALAASIDTLRSAYQNAAKAAGLLVAQQQSIGGLPGNQKLPTLGVVGPVLSGGGEFINEQELLNRRAEKTKSQFQIEQEKLARKNRGGRRSPTDRFQSDVEQIKARTEAIRAETAALAGLNPPIDDYGYAVQKAGAEQDLLNAAKRAGLKVTPELEASIEQLAEGYASASAQAARLAESQDEVRRRAEEFNDLARDAFGGFIHDLAEGKSAADALSDALGRVADRLIDIALNDLFSNKGGGLLSLLGLGGGGFAASDFAILANPGLYHSGGIAGSPKSRRAVPAGIFANAPRYHSGGIAGLRSGEVPAILQRGEIVVPKNASRASGAEMAGAIDINVNVSGARGNQEIKQMVESGVRAGIGEFSRNGLPVRVQQIREDPRKIG